MLSSCRRVAPPRPPARGRVAARPRQGAPATTPTTAWCSPTRRHPHGLRRRRRRRARRPRALPPAPPGFATGRDLDDPATIERWPTPSAPRSTLDLLAALTEADSLATGPTAWTTGRPGLLERLVSLSGRELRRRGAVGDRRRPTAPRPRARHLRRDARPSTRDPGGRDHRRRPTRSACSRSRWPRSGVHAQDVRRARHLHRRRRRHRRVRGGAGASAASPTGTRFGADLRAALVDAAPRSASSSARRRAALRHLLAADRGPARRPRGVRRQRRHRAATLVEVRAADGIGVLARIADAFARHGRAGRPGVRVDPRPRGGRHLLRDRRRRRRSSPTRSVDPATLERGVGPAARGRQILFMVMTSSGNARHNIQQSPAAESGAHDHNTAHQLQGSGAAQDDVRPEWAARSSASRSSSA